jgi:hypothetical protein
VDKKDASCREATHGNILDKRVSKRTKRKEYFEYLVKWKGHPVEDASWENEAKI